MYLTTLGLCVLLFNFLDVDAATGPQLRNVINNKNKLWEREMMVYQISSLIDDSQKTVIEESMREFEHNVSTGYRNCITFQKKEGAFRDRTDYVFITLATNRSVVFMT
ncbi:uncharacterized protein LOC110441916 [Mizuhopecten yessoensis]|uniref:uncharacterized protein LOC110441916 n=1 Tax=Mizuhopecten yessoensis TaxID=6573 RepID=UPI000B45D3E2|nr:uncharacterized protein LOC110441916 [Mizuhopecten yessoensis]